MAERAFFFRIDITDRAKVSQTCPPRAGPPGMGSGPGKKKIK